MENHIGSTMLNIVALSRYMLTGVSPPLHNDLSAIDVRFNGPPPAMTDIAAMAIEWEWVHIVQNLH